MTCVRTIASSTAEPPRGRSVAWLLITSLPILAFSYLLLLTHLHLMHGFALEVTPFMDTQPHGVFATRSLRRLNLIGLSIVRLVRVEGATLNIEEVDLVDGTPVLDIKPYVPQLDDRNAEGTGWFAENVHKVHEVRADDRIR